MTATPTRQDKYLIINALYSRGVDTGRIAKSLRLSPEFVTKCVNVASWPANKRNAWLMGINVDKFRF